MTEPTPAAVLAEAERLLTVPVAVTYDALRLQVTGLQIVLRDLLADRDRLAAQVEDWRVWIQFMWLDGGKPEGTDQELRVRACKAQDARLRAYTVDATERGGAQVEALKAFTRIEAQLESSEEAQ